MILALDIGNTNIVIGCIDEQQTYFVERLRTDPLKTELEYALDLKNVLELYGVTRDDLEGGIISSVVPPLSTTVKLALEKVLDRQVLCVGPGIRTGLNIKMDNPASVGADLIGRCRSGCAGLSHTLNHYRYGNRYHHDRSGSFRKLYRRRHHSRPAGVVRLPGSAGQPS